MERCTRSGGAGQGEAESEGESVLGVILIVHYNTMSPNMSTKECIMRGSKGSGGFVVEEVMTLAS